MKDTERDDTPILITAAEQSYDEEHAARKRKYLIMMGMRLPFMFAALIFINTWWLALGLILVSIPLPWIAVLIANDRPPRKPEKVNRFEQTPLAIEHTSHQVIEGE